MSGSRAEGLRVAALMMLVCLLAALPASASVPKRPASTRVGSTVFLPMIRNGALSYRLGYGAQGNVAGYTDLQSLKAGWYLNWTVQARPERPGGVEFVQNVNVHQKLTCPLYSAHAHDRTLCPYVQPYDYVATDRATIEAAAKANPGSLWFIGNEMDRRDWEGGGQDEILPEIYAVAYHDLYLAIKGFDPTARVGIGGVIQPTPLRLEYLGKTWDAYRQRYGASMPVDVWNVHNFILREKLNSYGASIPPGSTAETGVLYPPDVGGDSTHVSMAIFDQQIRAFRAFMADRGEQDKPLIVSEYGVLYSHISEADTAAEVQAFMVNTFDYFLNTRDCSLGLRSDGCRLVQRWAWFSLNDIGLTDGFNSHGALYDPRTKQITSTGERFRAYSLENLARLSN